MRLIGGDGLGPVPPEIPPARVESYDGKDYRLIFESPLVLDGNEEHFALVRSRHQGYPLSGAKRRHTAAGAVLESGRGFVAEIEIMG